jgi:hypothetical protein
VAAPPLSVAPGVSPLAVFVLTGAEVAPPPEVVGAHASAASANASTDISATGSNLRRVEVVWNIPCTLL